MSTPTVYENMRALLKQEYSDSDVRGFAKWVLEHQPKAVALWHERESMFTSQFVVLYDDGTIRHARAE